MDGYTLIYFVVCAVPTLLWVFRKIHIGGSYVGGIYFYCDAGNTIDPVTEKGRAGAFTDNKSSFLHAVNLFFLFAVICRTAAVFIL